ncbi:unnamed protein product, partial [Chrysoparadoxa australica]
YELVKKKPKSWTSLKEVNYTAVHALVVSEDWAFYDHNGYDLGQIKEAAEEAVKGERTRGASTISQQVVKNLFLSPEKSITRKAKELMYSTYMERNVSKEKILETYINIAEFGPGIYGIKAASQYYFKKSPKDLTPKEGAFLAMLLPSPVRYGESFREGSLTPFAEKTVNSILDKMVRAKYLKADQAESAKEQNFNWSPQKGYSDEDKKISGKTTGSSPEAQVEKSDSLPNKAVSKKASRKAKVAKKKRKAKGSNTAFKGGDPDLQLEENPNFDEDAINEDLSGLEPEFNVQ